MLAQAIVRQAKGQITPEAKQLISKALEENPSDPGANFLSGLASSQIGNEKKAFDIWVKLYKNTSMNDPWMENLEINIRTAANNIGISDDILEKHLSKNIIMNPNINDKQINEMMTYLSKAKRAHPVSSQLQLTLDKNGDVSSATISGKPIDKTKTYYVATNDYLYNGGDRMTFFHPNDSLYVLNYKIRNVLIDYFKKRDTLNPKIDRRFIKLND